jgi:hypothetical protein
MLVFPDARLNRKPICSLMADNSGQVAPDWRFAWNGLEYLYAFDERLSQNFVKKAQRLSVGAGTPTFGTTAAGISMAFDGTTWLESPAGAFDAFDGATNVSLLLVMRTSSAGFEGFFSLDGDGDNRVDIALQFGTSIRFQVAAGATTLKSIDTSVTADQLGRPFCFIATFHGATRMAAFLNGKRTAADTATIPAAFPTSPSVYRFGRNQGATAMTGHMMLAAGWKRTLSDEEAAKISANPFGMIRTVRAPLYIKGASGGGGGGGALPGSLVNSALIKSLIGGSLI